MTRQTTEDLIDTLGIDTSPVRPLRSPMRRGAATIAVILGLGGLAVLLLSDRHVVAPSGESGPMMLAMQMAAMLLTGILAVIGAFHLSIPGRSRRWLAAPLIPFAAWLTLSGVGCYGDLVQNGPSVAKPGYDCILFILAASLVIGAPLLWRLSRAAPIDPLPVAALGGLGTAAFAALLLQFFHPFTITFLDLGFHLGAVLTVVLIAALLKRPMLRPA